MTLDRALQTKREIVEAGAGCGKTYGLVSRYLEGLGVNPETGRSLRDSEGRQCAALDPSEILAVTFTEEAAAEMKKRVFARLKSFSLDAKADEVNRRSQISTFHSLCFRLIRDHLEDLGYLYKDHSRSPQIALMPPAISKMIREKHLTEFLAASSKPVDILRHLDLKDSAKLGAELWFSAQDPQRSLEECESVLSQTAEHFKTFRAEKIAICETLVLANPKWGQKGWLMPFLEALKDPRAEMAKNLEFRSGRDLAKDYPELLVAAQNYRDFLKKGWAESVEAEALGAEVRGQQKLLAFFAAASRAGPKLLDFSALEAELLKLKAPVKTAPKLLLVDEFQDTNLSQLTILEHLSSSETEWYLVGDPKQSIYAFRGADVSLFLKLRSQLKLKSLDTNRRSEASLLRFINEVQNCLFAAGKDGLSLFDPPPQVLKPARDDESPGPSVQIVEAPGDFDFADDVLKDYRRSREELGETSRHAFLFASWKSLYRYADRLREEKISFRISGSEAALDHQLTFLFCDYLEWLDSDLLTLAPISLLKWQGPPQPSLKIPTAEELAKLRTRVGWAPEGPLNPLSGMRDVLQVFANFLQPERWKQGLGWLASAEALVEEFASTGAESNLKLKDYAELLRNSYRELGAKKTPSETFAGDLELLTIHGSKGLEFDAVYLPELYEKNRRSLKAHVEDDESTALALKFTDSKGRRRRSLYFERKQRDRKLVEEAEQRRLFYVALTRAKKRLHLYLHSAPALAGGSSLRTTDNSKDAFAPFGWPHIESTFWNRLLLQLKSSDAFAELIAARQLSWREIAGEASPALAGEIQSQPTAEKFWRWPQPIHQRPAVSDLAEEATSLKTPTEL